MKKRAFLLICVLLLSMTTFAQEHLKFKGIPITGSMTSFCQHLCVMGYNLEGTNNNVTLFSGEFTGRPAKIGVGATDDGKEVHSVAVLFDPSEEWSILVDTYTYYKELYTKKYGEPKQCEENNPSRTDTNMSHMIALEEGRVTYASRWEVEGGTIELYIIKSGIAFQGLVAIKYQDAQNVEKKIQKDLDEI